MARIPLLQFDDNSYPDELIIKLQGMDKLRAFRNRITVPISHIESMRVVTTPVHIQNERRIKVVGAGGGGIGRRKVGASLECNDGSKKNQLPFQNAHNRQTVQDAKAITITLKDERCKELCLQVDDAESKKVVRVLQEMLTESAHAQA